jgi:hypothetical protein
VETSGLLLAKNVVTEHDTLIADIDLPRTSYESLNLLLLFVAKGATALAEKA